MKPIFMDLVMDYVWFLLFNFALTTRLGSKEAAESIQILEKYEIKTILNFKTYPIERKEDYQITEHHFPTDDNGSTDITQYFEPVFSIINESIEKKENILLHCYSGMNRSASFLLAYLIHSKTMRLQESFDFVRKNRNFISPDKQYMQILCEFETKSFGDCTFDIENYVRNDALTMINYGFYKFKTFLNL